MKKINENLPPQPTIGEGDSEKIHDQFGYDASEDSLKPRNNIDSSAVAKESPVAKAAQPTRAKSEKKPSQPDKKKEDDFDLLKYVSIVFRRKKLLLVSVVGFILIGLFKDIGKIDRYQAETKLLIQLKQQNPVGQFDPGYFWDRQTKINTLLNTIKSREVLQRVLDKLDMHLTPAALGSRITTERLKETNIIRVMAVSEIPAEATSIANTLAHVFVEFNGELNRKDISDALMYIERQIVVTEKELREKEDALKIFIENNEIVGSEESRGGELSKLSGLEADIRATNIMIIENEERQVQVRRFLKELKVYVEESYTFDNSLEAGLIKHNIDLANTLAEYGEQHYKVKQIREKINQLTELAKKNQEGNVQITSTRSLNQTRQSLLQEYNGLIVANHAARAKRAALESVLKEAMARITQIPAIQLEFHRMKRDKQNIEQVYQLLQTKYQEQRIKYEMQSADIVQWEVATIPTRPMPQGSRFGLLAFIVVGIVVGAAFAFALEFLDQSVKNPQEVEDELGLPILGIIPLMDEDSKVIDLESKSSILEPYRSLRTNIRYTNVDSRKRVILVTSAIQGDGKTTKVCNLAISFALDGKKVIVIDCDLRRASIHKVLGVEREPGLSDYLAGQVSLDKIEKKVFDGMISVIPAGTRPPNPAELLGSLSLDTVIQYGAEHFDVVLVDSPAIVPVSDALLLVPHVDSTIIIGRSMKTPKKAMLFAKNALTRAGANLIGAVFNGVEQRSGYYPYYYSYYSYYSYYRSKYYYYDDDNEANKLPKNFKEFIFFTIRESVVEVKNWFGRSKKFVASLFARFGMFRKKIVVIALSVLLLLIVGGLVYGTVRRHKLILGAEKEAVSSSVKTTISYKPNDSWFASSARADSVHTVSELSRMTELWKNAWEKGNIFEYRNFYSQARFSYRNGGYKEWISLKDSIFSSGTPQAKILVDSLQFIHASETTAVAKFYQGYSGDGGSNFDYGWKLMYWRKENGLWKITKEGRFQ